MGLETGVTYIEDLDETWPLGSDDPDTLDNHDRNTKTAVKGSFPSLGAAAVTKTAAEINALITETGTETLTNKTLTSPIINEILDANSNPVLGWTATGSAVNYLNIINAAADGFVTVSPAGTDDDIQLNISPKGNDSVIIQAGGAGNATLLSNTGDSVVQSTAGDVNIVSSGDTIIDATVTDSVTAETTDGDLVLAGNGTGGVTINSKPAYGMVVLDTHEALVSGSAAVGSWTQFDMSGGGTEAAAAATAGAVKAIIKILVQITEGSAGGSGNGSVYIQKNALGGAIDATNIVAQSIAVMDSGSSVSAVSKQYVTITVNLDGNSDFEYQIGGTGTAISWAMHLVGYYV